MRKYLTKDLDPRWENSLALACYIQIGMKKPDIAKQMARRSKSTVGEAADSLDRLVQQIVSDLRKGKDTCLPGLGDFTRDPSGNLTFRPGGGTDRD